ncbi:MAG: GEVED domain-containing protein [Bacteroidia bacterium]
MRKITLLLTLFLLGITGVHAQASLYGFSASSGTYTPITGGTVIVAASADNTTLDSYASSLFTLPTGFTYGGTVYTQGSVSSNGHLSLGTPVTSAYTTDILTTTTAGNVILAPFAADLVTSSATDADIRMQQVGSEIVFQWRNFRRYTVTESFSFQIRLNVTDKSIKFVYAGTPPFGTSTSYQPQVGIKSAVGDYKALVSANGGSWAAPTVITTGATSSSQLAFTGSNAFTNGLTYTFSFPGSCAGTPVGGTISGDVVRAACPGATPDAITVPFVNNSLGFTYQWQQSANGTDWTDVTTGTGATSLSFTPGAYAGTTISYRLKTSCATSEQVAYTTNVVTINPIAAPTTQATAFTVTPNVTSATFNWTNGNGGRRLVYISSTPIVDPVNGNFPAFTATTAYANTGQQLVYDGTGTSVTVTALPCSGTIYAKVYEYNRCGAGPYDVYYITTGTANAASFSSGPQAGVLGAVNNFTGFTGSNLSTAVPGWYEASIATTAGTTPTAANPVAGTSAWTNSTALGVATAKVNLYTNTTNAWIISPKMQLTANSRVKFKAAITDYNSGSPDLVDGELGGMRNNDDKVIVYVSTDGCGATWTPLYTFGGQTIGELSNVLTDYMVSLSAYTGQTVQIGFRATDGPRDDDPDYDFHITNIVVEPTPSCDSPFAITAVANTYTTATVNWSAPAGGAPAGGYEYYYSTTNTAPAADAVPNGTVAAGVLTANLTGLNRLATYYIWVRSVCSETTKSPWSSGNPIYTGPCTPAPSSVDGTGITRVVLGTINNPSTSETGNYGNYTAQSTTADAGTTVNFAITYSTGYTYGTKIWVDWNNDRDFDDAGELVYTGLSGSANPSTLSGSFVIPTTEGIGGPHVVRIGGTDNDSGGTPCYTDTYGSYEDYTLNVTIPAAPAITSFTPESACAATAELTITGTGLANATVKVGDTTVQTTSVTATQIVATVPAGVTGVVSVTTVGGTATTNNAFTVTTPEALAISAQEAAICTGGNTSVVQITQGLTAYDTFTWSPATGILGNATDGYIFNPAATTTYILTASQSQGPCVATAQLVVTVNTLPTALTITPAAATACEGTVQALTTTGGLYGKTGVIGTGTTAPGATSYPNPFSAYYGGTKTQILYTAAELQALGFVPGSTISSLSFDFNASVAQQLFDFRIKIGSTTNQNTTAGFVPSTGLTTVYNANYTPVAGTTGWVPFALTTPYVWTGGNIIVEIAHNMGNSGNGSGTTTRTTTTAVNTVYTGARDGVTPAGLTAYDALTTYGSSSASTSRPNITFGFTAAQPVTWAPVTGLYTDQAGTVPYTEGTAAAVVYAKPSATTSYVATSSTPSGCTASATAVVTINSVVAPTAPAALTFCQGAAVAELTATGESIQWYAAQTGGEALSPNALLATGTYYATQTLNGCESFTRAAVAVTVNVVEVAELDDVTVCGGYTLPQLNAGAYYSEAGGQGDVLVAGDIISFDRTIYIFAQSGQCTAETSFTVTMTTLDTPVVEDVVACNSYTLPQLNAGNYYIAAGGQGNPVPAGTTYSDSTTLYVFVQSGTCTAEASFDITISNTPVLTAVSPQVVSTQNDVATIEDIVVTADGPVQWYASEADYANNNPLPQGTPITANTTYFAGQSNGTCSAVITVMVSEILGNNGFDITKFAYYPNPVNNILNISYSSDITAVSVYNVLGQNVINVKPNAATAKVNMEALAEGTYVVKVEAGSVSKTIKIVKK